MKDKTIYVPFTEKNPTTAGELKGNVQAAETAEVSVVSGEKTLKDQENIADAMTMRITAEDGKTNDYTIKQKNTYNWALDYAGPQQGNVWFGQKKAASGEWTEIKEYDSQYPNWMVNTYYGPGIDEQSHSAKPTEATHGLLSAPPSTGISTAMAYRVPKDGMVSFHVKDDEPYLRQNGNSGGTVTLKLLVNDEEKQSVILEQSKVQAKDWKAFDKIEVKRGDYIRVAAISNGNPTNPSVHVTPIITYLNEGGTPAPEPTPELKAPVDVKVSEITETSAKASWKNAADGKEAAGYNVYVDGVKLNKELLTEASCGLTNLKAETTYFVEVTAVDAAGNESVKSEKVTFKTLKAEEQKEDSTLENNEKPGAVQTGDHVNVFVWMIGLLISASAAVAVMFKRNKNR